VGLLHEVFHFVNGLKANSLAVTGKKIVESLEERGGNVHGERKEKERGERQERDRREQRS
jgi:hypothetical protein